MLTLLIPWGDLNPAEITALVSSTVDLWNSTTSWFTLQSSPTIFLPQHLICFTFKFTRSTRALMSPYLLNEDQRPSLLFLVFYICEGWHNISDDSLSFHQRMPSFSSICLFLSLNILQTISMLPSHTEFHSVLHFENTRNITHHHSILPPGSCFVPLLCTKPCA